MQSPPVVLVEAEFCGHAVPIALSSFQPIASFFVQGRPITKGSMTATIQTVWSRKQGRMVSRSIAHATNPDLKGWEWQVGMAAANVMRGKKPAEGTPLRIDLTFYVAPQKTIRCKHPTGKKQGDIDKYTRGVLDGLTNNLYHDDSCVCELNVKKKHADQTHPIGVQIDAWIIAE